MRPIFQLGSDLNLLGGDHQVLNLLESLNGGRLFPMYLKDGRTYSSVCLGRVYGSRNPVGEFTEGYSGIVLCK